MKNAIYFALVLLAGCNSGSKTTTTTSSPTGSESDTTRPRIALIMKSLANEFFSTMAKGAETHQAEHADQYELISSGIKDETDLSRQVELVEEMVAAGAEAIVIAPADSKALIPALRRAQNEGVVVVNIDNRLDKEVLEQEGITIPFVGPNNRTGAKKVGDYLAGKLSKGDAVAILEGIPTSFNGQQRKLGFEDAMNEAAITIVDSQSAQWEMSKANTIAASMLSEHADIKAILAANDSMALGAIAAVRSAGKTDDVIIVGFDNISAAQTAIKDERMLATADQYGDKLAVYGIEYALALLNDPATELADRETPVDLVTLETLNSNQSQESQK